MAPIRYKVKKSDCISSIAAEHGLTPKRIWDHPDNADLKALRQDPDVLAAGDIVVIPDRAPKKIDRATGQRHSFLRKGIPKTVRIQFQTNGEPIGDRACEINLDGQWSQGETDAEGWLELRIQPSARVVRVLFEDMAPMVILLGELEPVESTKGLQQRLSNLGLFDDPIDGQWSESLRLAVAGFQVRKELPETGEPDEATREALVADAGD